MTLYTAVGRALVGFFVGLASLVVSTPTPRLIPPPKAIEINIPLDAESEQISPFSLLPTINPGKNPNQSRSIKLVTAKTASAPQKISVIPENSLQTNFQKVFQYSISAPASSSPIIIPSPSIVATSTYSTTTPTHPITQTAVSSTIENNSSQQIKQTTDIKEAVVNIYCTIKQGNTIKAITGSGVLIDPHGIILTNAHVGEYPLLQDAGLVQNLNCIARSGSPVNQSRKVHVIYISKNWINQNYSNIVSPSFTETGEGDIALLTIDLSSGNNSSIKYISTNFRPSLSIGDSISIASYPANILSTNGISTPLIVVKENLQIGDLFDLSSGGFSGQLIDSTDSLQAAPGSSGGAMIDAGGNLIGLISLTTSGNSPFAKHVRALSMDHVNSVILRDTGSSLSSFLAQNLDTISRQFNMNDRTSLAGKLIFR